MKSFTIALNSGSFMASAISASISSAVRLRFSICLIRENVSFNIFKPFAEKRCLVD